MSSRRVVCVLASVLSCPTSFLAPATASDAVTAARKIDATFLSLDAARSRVTYRETGTGEVKTTSVASPAVLEKLARLRGGQKVSLVCGNTAASGEMVVWDVKKKANWWKRGIILGVIVMSVAFVAEVLTSPPL